MSESFQAALRKVDYGKYIDQIQNELSRSMVDIGPGKTPGEVEAIRARLQECIGRLSVELAKEAGLVGNQIMAFMLSNSIISTAWVAFTLRLETSELTKSPEERLVLLEMFDALANTLADVVQEGSNYADRYGAPAEGSGQEETRKE